MAARSVGTTEYVAKAVAAEAPYAKFMEWLDARWKAKAMTADVMATTETIRLAEVAATDAVALANVAAAKIVLKEKMALATRTWALMDTLYMEWVLEKEALAAHKAKAEASAEA